MKKHCWIACGDPNRFALPKGLATASRLRLFYLSALPGKPGTLPNKKAPHFVRGLCCPTWIRTKTN
jgi:hypothetical protein